MLNTQDYIKKEVNELQIEQHNVLAQELISVIDDNDSEEEKIRKINDLIDKGANVNFHDANRSNDTPLHTATRKGEAKIVELLITRGALISNKNTQNNTPLELAINLNKQDIVQILRKVDINELQIDNVDNEKEDLIKAFELFKEIFPYGSDNLEDYLRKRRLLPRIEALLLQMDNWLASHPLEKKTIEENYIVSLLMWICDGYAHTWNPKKNKELLERALAIEEERYGRDHFEIAITLGNLGNAYGALGDHQKKKQLLERALAIEEEHYGRNHFEVARTLGNLGNVYGALGDFNKQKELLARALAIEEEHYGRDHLEIAITLGNLSNAYGALGDFNKQKELLEWTLAIFEKHYGHDHLEVAVTFGNLGNTYGDLGDHQKKKELLEKALPILEKHYGRNHSEVAITLGNLGNAYGALGDPQKKKQLLEYALTIQERHYGCDHAEVARILVNLGNVYGALGDPNKQKELLERALYILEKHYGHDHLEVAITLGNLGNAYGDLGDHQKKKELLEQALEIQEKHYSHGHFEVAITLSNLGNAYGNLGDPQKKKELLERALAIEEEHYGHDHFEVAVTLGNLGNAYGALGDFNKQKELLEQALEIKANHYGSDHFEVAIILGNLGTAYGALGNPQKQKELLERTLEIKKRYYGHDHFEVARILENLGYAYGILGDLSKQKELFEQALEIQERYYGHDHSEVAITLGNLGTAYGALGDHQKQKQLLERALPILKEHYGANHQYTLTAIRSIERAQEKISKFNIQQHSTQEEAFLNLFKFTSNNMPNIKIQSVKQGLYLPSFLARAVEIDGKCTAITRMFSQALLFDLTSDPVLAEQFLKNMESSAELYERLAQGKQISAREERDVFDFSRMLDDFEQQFNSPTSSLPSSLSHMKSYKTPADLSKFMYELSGNCALHLVTSNHVVAIYKTGDTYAYFDTNVAFISGIQTIPDLMKVVEKGVEFAGYELEPEGFLVEYFDVTRANHELTEIQKEILRDPIQTERHLLSLQDQNLGLLNINGKEISRVTLYDIGTKVNVADGVPILINAEMNLNSEKVINHLNKGELSITAREYLNNLKNGRGQEVIDAPFIGSSREVKNAEQARKFMALSAARELTNYESNNLLKSPAVMSDNSKKISSTLIDALLANVSPLEGQTKHLPYLPPETTNAPQTYLNSIAIRTLLCYGRTI